MNMIEIQDAYVSRVLAAHSKIGKRSAGLRFAGAKRAARKEATKRLARIGYDDAAISAIIKDAYDMVVLEIAAS